MAMTLPAAWTAKIANPTQIVVLVTISNGTFTEYYCSGATKFLVSGAEPNAVYATPNVDDVTPIEIKFDPKTRKPGSGQCTILFSDDGAIRALNRDWKLRGKRVVVEFLDITDVAANRAPHFRGSIEDIVPVDDGKKQIQLVARGGLGLAMNRKVNVTGAIQVHPLQVVSTILTKAGVPAELINGASLDPDAVATPHSHFVVNRRTPLNGYDTGIKQAETAGALIEELVFPMNGSLVEMEDGTITFVRYDYTKAPVATYDVSQIKNFRQISQMDLLVNKATFKVIWKGAGAGGGTPQAGQPQQVGPVSHLVEGDYVIALDHSDATSIAAYAFPGGTNGEFSEAFESKWINAKTYLAASISSGATSFDVSGGGLMCLCGTRPGSFGGVTAGRPSYLLIDNEIVKVTGLVLSTNVVTIPQVDEDGVVMTAGGGTSVENGSSSPTTSYGTALAASATLTVARGALNTTAAAHGPSLWAATHVYAVGDVIVPSSNLSNQSWVCITGGTSSGTEPAWPANPVLGQTTQLDTGVTWRYNGPNTGCAVYDVTMAVEYLLALIGRGSDGIPMLEFELPLTEHFLQVGDFLALTEEVGIRYGFDGLTSADNWEIVGKRTQPLGDEPGVKVTVALARTPPAYTQAWTPRLPKWHGFIDRLAAAGQHQDTIISHAPNQTGILASAGAGLNLNVSAGQLVHFGIRHDVAAVASHGLTANKDVYITFDAETGFLVKRELANGAAAPSIAPSELLVAKVVTGASISSVLDKLVRQPFHGELIVDASILTPKIADGAVTNPKVGAGAITNVKVDAAAAIDGSKLKEGSGPLTHLSAGGALDDIANVTTRPIDSLTDATYARPLAAGLSSGKINLAAGTAGLANRLPAPQIGVAAVTPEHYTPEAAFTGNLIPNANFSSFTAGTGSPPDAWTDVNSAWGTKLNAVTTPIRSGSQSIQFVGSASSSATYKLQSAVFPVAEGHIYMAGAEVWENGVALTAQFLMQVDWLDISKALISSSAVVSGHGNVGAGQFYRIYQSLTAPANARYARAVIYGADTPSGTGANTEYIDNVWMFEQTDFGTGFPDQPFTGQRFFRTDRGILYYYDGTRWLSVNEFQMAMPGYAQLPSTPISAVGNAKFLAALPYSDSGNILVTRWSYGLSPTATNNGSNFWSFRLSRVVSGAFTAIVSGTTASLGTTETWLTIGALDTVVPTDATAKYLSVDIHAKTGTPGNLTFETSTVHYRLIG